MPCLRSTESVLPPQLSEAVIDGHKANAGYGDSHSASIALLVMQWFLKPLYDAIM